MKRPIESEYNSHVGYARAIEDYCNQLEQAQKQGCTRSHPHEEMNKECELRTEIARLTNCLSRANALAERFERESYLLGDELEKLQAQKQEPVAWLCEPDEHGMYGLPLSEGTCTKCFPVYREPPQQSTIVRQPLTDEQIQECWLQQSPQGLMSGGIDFARAIEAAHGIKE
jgi:HPt (histidine-containing phosphotransfer) domain-containing protein